MAVPRDGVGAGSALPCHYVRAGACDADGGCVHAARGRCSRPCPAAAPPTTTASTTRPRLSRRRPRGSRNEREPIGSRPMPCISRANGPFVHYSGAWDTHPPATAITWCAGAGQPMDHSVRKNIGISTASSLLSLGPSINLRPAITLNPML